MKNKRTTIIYLSGSCKRLYYRTQPSITVIVVDGNRKPISGADVILIKLNLKALCTKTDSKGKAEFRNTCHTYSGATVVVSYQGTTLTNCCTIDRVDCGCEVQLNVQ